MTAIRRKLLVFVLCSLFSGFQSSFAAPPNIVLIFADDLGWKDVGYQGSDFMETPNLDRLTKEGMVFTNGYAAAGNCAPSRACLLSGTYTPRHHVYAVAARTAEPRNPSASFPCQTRAASRRKTSRSRMH
jgi:arylsulfatase A-like enzyme